MFSIKRNKEIEELKRKNHNLAYELASTKDDVKRADLAKRIDAWEAGQKLEEALAKQSAELNALRRLKLNYLDLENEKLELLAREHNIELTEQKQARQQAALDQQAKELAQQESKLVTIEFKQGHTEGYESGFTAGIEAVSALLQSNSELLTVATAGQALGLSKAATDAQETAANVLADQLTKVLTKLLETEEK